jgi:hypothetical protein
MKKRLFLILLTCFTIFLYAQETDILSIPNPIEFDGTEFFLARAKQRSKTLFQQQYIPNDEEIENFSQILDFSFFNKEIDIEQVVKQKVEMVQERRKKDKLANVNVSESPDGNEYIVDFLISETPEKGDPFVEYNIFRFKNFENGSQKNFLMLSYAKRINGDIKSSAKALAKQRDRLMTSMIEYKIPEIKILVTTEK